MFKSTFVKYLITFVLIISISFAILFGIITSMIKAYSSEEKETKALSTSSAISIYLEDAYLAGQGEDAEPLEDLTAMGALDVVSNIITPLINQDTALDVIVILTDGTVVLTTAGVELGDDDIRHPEILGELGKIDFSCFEKAELDNNKSAYIHRGTLNGFLKDTSIACADDVYTNGEIRGYVISLYSTASEDAFIAAAKNAVIHSCIWVLLAAVIAVYFITERMIHPLRNMTSAAKKFGKGDFSTRVTVYGNDEVAELSEAFNNMADSLENLEKMRNSFLASVSHDLRTPMTTIAGFVDGMRSGAIPPESQDQYLEIISSEVHRLSRLVSQLLDISRLESGDRKMNFTAFDVSEIARIILISFEQRIEEKQLDVEFDSESDEVLVSADKDAIHQVLYNLCHNAIKFANDGGKFVITIKSIDSKRVRISVFDEGQTISKEDAKMVFERFYKTDSSRGLDKTGVGLGLYISKTIVDAHGESIGVETNESGGTEFWFTLKKG